jgi:hypothetical protein
MTAAQRAISKPRRRPRFGSRRVPWWPLLLIPLVVWAAYAVGTPWNESAPLGAGLGTYGEPLDIRDVRSEVRWRHEFIVEEISLHRSDETREIFDLAGPFVEAVVKFDGRPATIYVYPDPVSVERDWWYLGGQLQPRNSAVADVHFTQIENIVVVEGGWGLAWLAEALQNLDR